MSKNQDKGAQVTAGATASSTCLGLNQAGVALS